MITRVGAIALVVAASGSVVRAADPDPEAAWLDAYKREYALLEAERDALAARLAETRAESARAVAQVEGRIARLQGELVAARAEADRVDGELATLEREQGAADDRADLVPQTIARAQASLEAAGERPAIAAAAGREPSDIAALVEAATRVMGRTGRVEVGPGTFFLTGGDKVDGRVVRLGGVMAWGVSERGSGALAPAGGGHLQLWPGHGEATARALADGQRPSVMGALLYEDAMKRMEPRAARSFSEYTTIGGPIAWAIVALGGLAALFVLGRAWLVLRPRTAERRLRARLTPIIGEARRDAVSKEALQERLDHAFLAEAPRLERFATIITVLAAIAPLLGLLGTVTGMIATFDIITEHGNSDPKLLSGGISEALITTEYGLMVAIPTLFLGTLLTGRANTVLTTLERVVLEHVAAGADPAETLAPKPPDAAPTSDDDQESASWMKPSSEPSPT